MSDDFTNKRVVVTGASSGIGFAVARAFACAGAHVHILAECDEIFQAASRISTETGSKVAPIQCDITNSSAMEHAMSDIDDIDIFIANAGRETPSPISDLSADNEKNFKNVIDTNVNGTYLSLRSCIPKLAPSACIIITSSIWGKTAVADFSAYIASKHANLGLMRTLAKELGSKNIRVNAVCPGWVKTQPAMNSLRSMAIQQRKSEAALLDEISSEQCIDGVQNPDDVALCYLMLASKYAANITGQAVNADRGALLY